MIVLLEYISHFNGSAKSGEALATPAPPSEPPLILHGT